VIRTNLRYHAPTSVAEACHILAEATEGAVLGGGTMLVPRMVHGERNVTDAVHIRGLGLDTIQRTGDGVDIGAGVTYTQVLEAPAGSVPALLTTMARGITGGAQIRNQGTLAGSASYANPSSDVPACLVALDATLHVHGTDGHRALPAAKFFRGPFRTDLRRDEILTRLSIPDVGVRSGYSKLKLSESSWPIVTAAAVAESRGDGGWRYRLGIGGASAVPVLVDLAALGESGHGLALDDGRTASLVRAAVEEELAEPWSDELAPGHYRRQVAGPVALRALALLKKEIDA
jgi:CO/xanthine dehydrogenase FAD-binding subunit